MKPSPIPRRYDTHRCAIAESRRAEAKAEACPTVPYTLEADPAHVR
jgi:hypothetical protein